MFYNNYTDNIRPSILKKDYENETKPLPINKNIKSEKYRHQMREKMLYYTKTCYDNNNYELVNDKCFNLRGEIQQYFIDISNL